MSSPSKALAKEADLWRELAEVNGHRYTMAASRGASTRRLNARYDLVIERLRRLGVAGTTPPAAERFAGHVMITHEEARALRAAVLGDAFDARVMDMVLGRIALELDAHVPNDDEPPTTRST